MTIHVALLRAINVGGHKPVPMAELREFMGKAGFPHAQSLLQTGNLIFRAEGRTGTQLERLLETEAEKRLDLRTDFFVRTAGEWDRVVAHNPFPLEADRDPGHLVVMILKELPGAESVGALQAAIVGPEILRAQDRQIYIVYPDGIGRSRLTSALIERKLGTRGTARNWNTVLKLQALAKA
jgi:uncharacterized protein (DUF1697 family)